MALSKTYNDNVFINCPFDSEYYPHLLAITFTIYRCGFYPHCALEEEDGTENRLSKIQLLIEDCKYGIHDISRTELDKENNLPRFNMPFELGLFFSAKRFGNKFQKQKQALIMDKEQFRYQMFISDLNGVDIKSHKNKTNNIIKIVRNWLLNASKRKTIPGPLIVCNDFNLFTKELSSLVNVAGLENNNVGFNDYCYIVEEWLKNYIHNS